MYEKVILSKESKETWQFSNQSPISFMFFRKTLDFRVRVQILGLHLTTKWTLTSLSVTAKWGWHCFSLQAFGQTRLRREDQRSARNSYVNHRSPQFRSKSLKVLQRASCHVMNNLEWRTKNHLRLQSKETCFPTWNFRLSFLPTVTLCHIFLVLMFQLQTQLVKPTNVDQIWQMKQTH